MRGRGDAFCWNCAGQPGENAVVCVQCGADLRAGPLAPAAFDRPAVPGARSKVTAGILGIFLGGFGVHRFYLGYTTIGIIQIVVTICTLGFGALWGFVEGILILCGQIRTDVRGQPLAE
jgi:TM2 domain-containing membrane protein YozV